MKSFIMITFGVLGFAFYELSGGDEFDAEALRLSRIDIAPDPIANEPVTRVAVAQTAAPAPVIQTLTNAEADQNIVSRSVVTLASLEAPSETNRVTATFATAEAEPAPTIILPSLIVSNSASAQPAVIEQVAAAVEPQKAIRIVSGNRVNVRGGPGTNYDVVNRLVKGQEVEILSDPGDGWVKLRPLEGGSVGWMADFLLIEG